MDTNAVTAEELASVQGAFIDSLRRNNKQIKDDRALTIYEDAEMSYKNTIINMERNLKRLKRNLENMLDLSPENVTTLKLATDFDPDAFVKEDGTISDQIHNLAIQLEIRKKRYNYLFGYTYEVEGEI